MREGRSLLKKANRFTDLVEIRLENITDLDLEKLLRHPRPKVIITNRTNGRYSESERFTILLNAVKYGAEYVDIEIESGKALINKFKNYISEEKSKTKLILSYHNFNETPKNLSTIYSQIKSCNADIIKVAVYANDISDNIKIFKLLERANKENIKLAAFCLGGKGEISRILAPRFGGQITYCSLLAGKETAEGQIPVEKLLSVYNYSSINAKTKIFGLVGNPVSHSRGIYIHNEFFKKNKLNAVYVNFLADDISRTIHLFKSYVLGLSVTIPFKEVAVKSVNRLSPEAQKTKAVNTIKFINQKLVGYNTDVLGLTELLRNRIRGKNVVVFGTGGSARSAVVAAKSENGKVIVMGRNPNKAQILAEEFNCGYDKIESLPNIKFDVFINATPIGMVPKTNFSPILPGLLKPNMLVVDFVYTPPMTKLVRDAKKHGCKTISGVEIFKRQAKLQQKIFKSAV